MQPITVSTPYKSEQIHLGLLLLTYYRSGNFCFVDLHHRYYTPFPWLLKRDDLHQIRRGNLLYVILSQSAEWDLNPHPFRDQILSLARIPISPSAGFLEHQARIELAPLGRKHNILPLNYWCSYTSACGRARSANLLITNQLHYQLCYTGKLCSSKHCTACGNLRQVLRSTLVKPMTLMGLPGLEPRSTD